MSRRLAVSLSIALLAAACGKDKEADAPAPERGAAPTPRVGKMHASGEPAPEADDPHAGMMGGGGGDDPHAGMRGGDPHAGMMGGGADPHAGMARPPREVDPSKFLRGQIVGSAETAPLIKPGAILFLSVKPIEPLSGDVIGSTLAVDRIDIDKLPLAFELTGANAMMATTKFEGDVVISARIDQDGEARSKQPGDIEGSVRAKIPAEGLTLTLDTVLK